VRFGFEAFQIRRVIETVRFGFEAFQIRRVMETVRFGDGFGTLGRLRARDSGLCVPGRESRNK